MGLKAIFIALCPKSIIFLLDKFYLSAVGTQLKKLL